MWRKKNKEISKTKCFVINVTISSYYISIFYFVFWRKDFFADAHACFVKPLITDRTSSHKVINIIFRIAHKKVLSAYTKNINLSLKKSATWNLPWNFLKRWQFLLLQTCWQVVVHFDNTITAFIWWQSKTNCNSKGNGKDPTINAIALLLNL